MGLRWETCGRASAGRCAETHAERVIRKGEEFISAWEKKR